MTLLYKWNSTCRASKAHSLVSLIQGASEAHFVYYTHIALKCLSYSTMHVAIQMDVNGSMTVFLAPVSVGNSTKRCAADENTSCAVDIDTLDPTLDYGMYGVLDAFQMRAVYYNFTAIFQGEVFCSGLVPTALCGYGIVLKTDTRGTS